MPINNNDDYDKLAKLLYPSIEASGNVYYGQTKKLALDELFNKNNIGFKAHIEADNDNNESIYYCWELGPLKGKISINKNFIDNLKLDSYNINVTADDFDLSKNYGVIPGIFSKNAKVFTIKNDNTYSGMSDPTEEIEIKISKSLFAKYKLRSETKTVTNIINSGNFNTYETFLSVDDTFGNAISYFGHELDPIGYEVLLGQPDKDPTNQSSQTMLNRYFYVDDSLKYLYIHFGTYYDTSSSLKLNFTDEYTDYNARGILVTSGYAQLAGADAATTDVEYNYDGSLNQSVYGIKKFKSSVAFDDEVYISNYLYANNISVDNLSVDSSAEFNSNVQFKRNLTVDNILYASSINNLVALSNNDITIINDHVNVSDNFSSLFKESKVKVVLVGGQANYVTYNHVLSCDLTKFNDEDNNKDYFNNVYNDVSTLIPDVGGLAFRLVTSTSETTGAFINGDHITIAALQLGGEYESKLLPSGKREYVIKPSVIITATDGTVYFDKQKRIGEESSSTKSKIVCSDIKCDNIKSESIESNLFVHTNNLGSTTESYITLANDILPESANSMALGSNLYPFADIITDRVTLDDIASTSNKIRIHSDLVPSASETIGTSTKPFDSIYCTALSVSNLTVRGSIVEYAAKLQPIVNTPPELGSTVDVPIGGIIEAWMTANDANAQSYLNDSKWIWIGKQVNIADSNNIQVARKLRASAADPLDGGISVMYGPSGKRLARGIYVSLDEVIWSEFETTHTVVRLQRIS